MSGIERKYIERRLIRFAVMLTVLHKDDVNYDAAWAEQIIGALRDGRSLMLADYMRALNDFEFVSRFKSGQKQNPVSAGSYNKK